MNPKDYIGETCDCPDCSQAGVTQLPVRRDWRRGHWMHGYELKRWYEARARFYALREQIKAKAMPALTEADRQRLEEERHGEC